jgi:hypothetical protein
MALRSPRTVLQPTADWFPRLRGNQRGGASTAAGATSRYVRRTQGLGEKRRSEDRYSKLAFELLDHSKLGLVLITGQSSPMVGCVNETCALQHDKRGVAGVAPKLPAENLSHCAYLADEVSRTYPKETQPSGPGESRVAVLPSLGRAPDCSAVENWSGSPMAVPRARSDRCAGVEASFLEDPR